MIAINELQSATTQLPDTIEDLTRFVLVGKTKLNEYLVKLRTIDKLSVAQEVRNQTLEEAQELNAALFAAEQRIGELLLAIPKHTAYNNPSGKSETQNRDMSKLGKSKSELTAEMGYTKDEVSDYQQMAKNPEIVQQVLDEAVANGTVASKSQVMAEIKKNNELKKRLAEQDQELQKLRNRPEQIREVTKEVFPDDYQSMKSKARAYDTETARLNRKLEEEYKLRNALQEEIKGLQAQTAREQANNDFVAGAIYFIAQCGSFIRDVGGYVWIADKLADLPERDRIGYIKAAIAVRDWATALLQNIERSEYGKQEITRISLDGD